jgi:hypothetical protein
MKDYSQPAFPRPASEFTANGTCPDGNDPLHDQTGISTRDYFAAKAMQGMMIEFAKQGYPENDNCSELKWVVKAAYLIADAMLIEREK